ncbi:HdeD family acid-resistance protein [Devosia sp. FKR38]|uniref:HdeD family acid-resistance protein n=1 Tax=Devosia sp. FKR38 TaxID=2562312 RepID=UPI0010C1365D|nr:HdeD family acid-resistance protein [Devosia sp. FKR38]
MDSVASDNQPTGLFAGLARNWWALALRGLLGIVFGMVALVWPASTMLSLVVVFAAYALVGGVLTIIASVRAMASHDRWSLLLLEGIVSILAAVAALAWPGLTVISFVGLMAFWSIITGALMLGSAFRLDAAAGRWWMVLGAVSSVFFGIVLIWAPLTGAVVLTWWLGAYAIVFGIALIVLGFQLRSVAH